MSTFVRRRFRIALLALCTLLLAQWTLAAHACPVVMTGAPQPQQPATQHASHAAGMQHTQHEQHAMPAVDPLHGCHLAPGSEDEPAAPAQLADTTLCKKHCTDDVPSPGTGAGLVAIDAPVQVVLRVALPPPANPLPAATETASGDATAPPFTILYCELLT